MNRNFHAFGSAQFVAMSVAHGPAAVASPHSTRPFVEIPFPTPSFPGYSSSTCHSTFVTVPSVRTTNSHGSRMSSPFAGHTTSPRGVSRSR